MILSEVRDYLRERGQASLRDLALHFDASPEALRGMLAHWVLRGQVSRHRATGACGDSCTQCDPAAVELYAWGEKRAGEAVLVRDLGCSR
jgi:putative ferrous iron transport protein C